MQLFMFLLACLASVAAAASVLPRRKGGGGNLLQSVHRSSGDKTRSESEGHSARQPVDYYNAVFGDSPQRPDSFFYNDFEKMDELPNEPVKCVGDCAMNVIIMETTTSTAPPPSPPSIAVFVPSPATPAPAPLTATQQPPQPQPLTGCQQQPAGPTCQPKPRLCCSKYFKKCCGKDEVQPARSPPQQLAASPPPLPPPPKPAPQQPACVHTSTGAVRCPEAPKTFKAAPEKGCHPRCIWQCEEKPCNTKCQPRCAAPTCVTACAKPTLGQCKRTCQDPICAVVCPPQCEHGACPKCKTVCGDPICKLDCGNRRCESRCADPECVWDCLPDPACAKPQCSLKCEQTICTIGKEQQLPSEYEAPYLGTEIAWEGFGKVSPAMLKAFAPLPPTGAIMPPPAKPMPGAKMVPPEGLKSLQTAGCCAQDMGVNITADVKGKQANLLTKQKKRPGTRQELLRDDCLNMEGNKDVAIHMSEYAL